MSDTAVAGSFRDPHGQVFVRDGVVHRRVTAAGAADYDRLMGSGLYAALTREGLLIEHTELPDVEVGAHRVLRPTQVPFISYPSEWCPGQLRAGALATLRAQDLALDHGMTLRDASAFNVQLLDGRPVLIDTSSFGILEEGAPWVAYRQFCQHFLAPLALACLVDVRLLGLLRVHIDGIPLDLAAALLPGRTRITPSLGLHVHGHARSQRRHADDRSAPAAKGRFSPQAFRGLVDSLRSAVKGLEWRPDRSEWSGYYQAGESYADEAAAAKEALVTDMLGEAAPATVWDLGANTGRFSDLAAGKGASVVALEADYACVEAAWRHVVADGETSVLPLVCDLTNPTPGHGWAHRERDALADRGPADLVLALALVHHLAIAVNVPLPEVLAFLARLGRSAIVEFVPKEDAMVQRLLLTREDVFAGYTEDAFLDAARDQFEIVRSVPVASSARTLHLLRRR